MKYFLQDCKSALIDFLIQVYLGVSISITKASKKLKLKLTGVLLRISAMAYRGYYPVLVAVFLAIMVLGWFWLLVMGYITIATR